MKRIRAAALVLGAVALISGGCQEQPVAAPQREVVGQDARYSGGHWLGSGGYTENPAPRDSVR